MSKLINNYSALIITCLAVSPLYASNETGSGQPDSHETGTGQPTLNLAQSQDQRTVIQLDYQGVTLLGSTQLDQGYGEATLDAVDETGLRTDWGRAEILAGCDQADVIVYQLQNGLDVEVLATQVALDGCAGQ